MVCISTVSFIPKRNRSKMIIETTVIEFLIFIVIVSYFVLILADKRK